MNISNSGTRFSPKDPRSGDANPVGQEASPVTESDVRRKPRPKALSIQSLAQLLDAMYTGTFKRWILKKTELTAMKNASRLEAEGKEEKLLKLALSDRTLDRTLKLMLLADGLNVPIITNQIREFAVQVLQHHPAFGTNSLEGVLKNVPEGSREDEAIQELISRNYSSFTWPEETAQMKPMTKRELGQCKTNAVYCLLLRFRVTHGISDERIQQLLQEYLWKPASRRYKAETDRLRVLMTARDFAAASVASVLLEKQALEQRRRADDAHRAEKRARSHALEVKEKLAESQKKLTQTQSKVDRLEEELRQEIQTHANDRIHLKDDYEKLRGQVLHRLKAELSLLDDGLHALRREPPKVHVMVDHAERAIDGLKQEMKRLRGNG